MKKFLMLIIMSVFIITGCTSSTEKQEEEKVMFNSYDDVFTIEAEEEWQNVTKGELNKLANLEIVDYDNNKYFMALMEKKEDFELSYDEYIETMKKDIEEKYKIQLEEENDIKIGDYDCKYVEFKSAAQNSSVNFYMQIYILETPNYYGRLFVWTTYSQRDLYKEEFNNMVQTFKEK